MRTFIFGALGAVGLTLALAACGKAADGTCEETSDCPGDDDASRGPGGDPGLDAASDAETEASSRDAPAPGVDASDAAGEVDAEGDGPEPGDAGIDGAPHDAGNPADSAHPDAADAHAADAGPPDTGAPDTGPTCSTSEHLCNGACYPNSDLPTDDPCVISDAYGVFVSASLGSSSGTGTHASPYKTIGAGLAAAAAAGKRLYVCAETYPEAVALKEGVSMFGYLACAAGNWAVSSGRATVSAPTIPAASAVGLARATRVESFAFVAPNANQASGSSYGMFVSGTTATLTLVNDVIQAGSAGGGIAGGTGPAQVENPSCGSPSSATPSPKGQGVSATTPAAAPQYTSSGYVPSAGGAGAPGGAGSTGTAGGSGECTDQGGCEADPVAHLCATGSVTYCASAGSFGCGGPGGAAGLGATGGGTSVALYVWQSNVALQGGVLVAENGGKGGNGGTGAAAPQIASAQCPGGWPDCLGKRAPDLKYPVCGAPPSCKAESTLTGGSAGGNGGQGGQGGDGAGGSGGDSLGYYQSAGSTVSPSGVSFTLGNLGPGGVGGGASGAPGPSGVRAQHN